MAHFSLPLALVLGGGAARAESALRLRPGASPRTLQMRASAWRLAAADSRRDSDPVGDKSIFSIPSGKGLDLERGSLDRLSRHKLEQDVYAPPPSLSEKVIFRFNLGMGLDGGQPSGEPLLSDSSLDESNHYERLRIYNFGDAVLGSRGLGIDGLNSYFAAHFRYNQRFQQSSTALPSIYDRQLEQPLVRSAYAEVDQIIDLPRLRPLYLRAGRSFRYGISVMHFDGVTIGYDSPVLKLSVFGGQRANVYGMSSEVHDNQVSGSKLRIDLFEWRRWPLVVFANTLTFDDHDHFRTGLALRWNRDVLVSGAMRTLDGSLARSSLSVRARISEVTTINLQLGQRTRSDWSYGLLLIDKPDSAADPRRYLDLGPVLPRRHFSLRYGTVLLRNIDLLLRAGAAFDRRDEEADPASSFSSSYAEGGGALEIHMRRSLRVGAALSARNFFLQDDKAESAIPGQPDPLPATLGATGVDSFWEGGLNFMYSPGARQFSASAEFYGRLYRFQSEQLAENTGDLRTGGRFSVEGWVLDRLRLKTEYDVSFNRLLMAPELRGLKTLRVLVEGSF